MPVLTLQASVLERKDGHAEPATQTAPIAVMTRLRLM